MEKINEIPEDITVCNLECVLMPNGEVISNGKNLGWFSDFKKFLTIKDPNENKVCSICGEPLYGLVQVHHHNEKCAKCGYEMIGTQKHTCE